MTEVNEYSVYQFFEDGSHEKVRSFVSASEAAKAIEHYTTSVGASLGTTVRVIITDGMDCICYEWVYGLGVTFPTKEFFESLSKRRKK